MNTLIQVASILSVTVTTNEVPLGKATIGIHSFDVVGLQLITNRVISTCGESWTRESWTNKYPGPFIGTNLVRETSPTNIVFSGNPITYLTPSNQWLQIPNFEAK